MLSGVKPSPPNSLESAIEKQRGWAAAISSSGLVPLPSAKRLVNEYWVSESTPLSVEIVPLPSLRLPFQSADALRFMGYFLPIFPQSISISHHVAVDAIRLAARIGGGLRRLRRSCKPNRSRSPLMDDGMVGRGPPRWADAA